MATIINDPGRVFKTFSPALSTLEQLIARKIERKRQAQALESLGLPGSLSSLPEHIQREYIKSSLGTSPQLNIYNAPQQTDALEDILSGGQVSPSSLYALDQLSSQEERAMDTGDIDQTDMEFEEQKRLESIDNSFGTSGIHPDEDEGLTGVMVKYQDAPPEQESREQRLAKEISRLKKALENPKTPRALLPEIRKQLNEREDKLDKIAGDRRKIYAKELQDLSSRKKNASRDIQDLNRLLELEDEGLISAGYAEFLERSGFDIPALMNPASQEFKKLTQSFIRKAKEYFGGRITNREMQQFMKTIPTLSQSPEGRKRVIAQMKNVAEAELETYKTAQKIIKKNSGIPPIDLFERVDSLMEEKRKSLSEKFRKELKKMSKESKKKSNFSQIGLPGQQGTADLSSLGTAAGALAGEVVRQAPTIAGAIYGGRIGGKLGSVAGTLLG